MRILLFGGSGYVGSQFLSEIDVPIPTANLVLKASE